jgi:predicted lipoprotein with Yx(FWY)xxD motif
MKRSLSVVLASLVLIAPACGDDDADTTDTSAPAATDAPAVTDAPAATEPDDNGGSGEGEELALATTDLGEIIVDDEGMTMYLFVPDAQGDVSVCNGECAASWPPQVEIAEVGEGLDMALVGTITRDDGAVQGTYNGWPLYYFAGDNAPGDVNGQGLNDNWWVIDASGNAIGA